MSASASCADFQTACSTSSQTAARKPPRGALFPPTLLPMAAWVHYGNTDGSGGAALFITLLLLAACLNMAVYYAFNRYLTN